MSGGVTVSIWPPSCGFPVLSSMKSRVADSPTFSALAVLSGLSGGKELEFMSPLSS